MPKNLKQSRQNKKCLAMKKLNLEQMECPKGGNWLNNHSWRSHLLCVASGALTAAGGPLVVAGTMALCYMMLES